MRTNLNTMVWDVESGHLAGEKITHECMLIKASVDADGRRILHVQPNETCVHTFFLDRDAALALARMLTGPDSAP